MIILSVVLSLALSFYGCASNSEPIVLNVIGKIDPDVFKADKDVTDGIPCVRYTSLGGSYIFKVVEDHSLIWQRKSTQERCTEAYVYLHNDKPFLAHLTISDDDTQRPCYVMRKVGTWARVPKETFDASIAHEKSTIQGGESASDGFSFPSISAFAFFCITILTFHTIAE